MNQHRATHVCYINKGVSRTSAKKRKQEHATVSKTLGKLEKCTQVLHTYDHSTSYCALPWPA